MDWSKLVPEVLHIISKKLEKISDFVRFRAVYKAWRTSVPLCDPPPQFPWLVTLPLHLNARTLQLHSIISGETLTIPVPGGDQLIVGSVNGYVIFQGIYNKFLFNLLSERKIPLPLNLRNYRFQHISESNKKKQLLCSGCSRSSQLKFKKLQTEFFQPNIHNWHRKKEIDTSSTDLNPQHNIKCSLIKRDAFNDIMLSETPMPSEPLSYDDNITNEIIVESFEDVLRVTFKHDSSNAITGIDVHRLDQGNTFPHFVKIRSFGDRVLFFATCNSKCWSVSSDDIPRHKGNCIYFWNLIECDHEGDDRPECSYELSRYDLEEDRIEILPLRTEEYYIWLMPNLC